MKDKKKVIGRLKPWIVLNPCQNEDFRKLNKLKLKKSDKSLVHVTWSFLDIKLLTPYQYCEERTDNISSKINCAKKRKAFFSFHFCV